MLKRVFSKFRILNTLFYILNKTFSIIWIFYSDKKIEIAKFAYFKLFNILYMFQK